MPAVLASPENDLDRRASKDLPHLSLSLESPPNSSPFPSPSSSFIPPPVPGAHEFANKLPIHVSKKKQQRDSTEGCSLALAPTNPTAVAPGPASVATAPTAVSGGTSSVSANTDIPTTTNGATSAGSSTDSTAEEAAMSEEREDTLEQMRGEMHPESHSHAGSNTNKRISHVSTSSLNSSRRAPASPSVSRRASGAHNLNNVSGSNNRNSISLSRANSLAAKKLDGSASVSSAATVEVKRRSRVIKIRDFAYPTSDLRHTGQGPDAPRSGQPSRPASQYGQYGQYGDDSSRRNSGWGAFRWAGSKLWGFALGNGGGNGNGKQRAPFSTDTDGFIPTSSDFARNFDVSSPHEEYPSAVGAGFSGGLHDGYNESVDSLDPSEGESDTGGYPDQDYPLLPGLYRAMYAFVPEGTAEMALAEDQIVRIVGRGGGVGWAVAQDEKGGHALVPESYLEIVQLDDDLEEGGRVEEEERGKH